MRAYPGYLAQDHILDTWPRIGVAKLRALWRASDDHDRELIAACAPQPGDAPRELAADEPASRAAPRRAAADLRREIRPDLRRPARPLDREPAVVATYHRDRAGVDDSPVTPERPDAYAIDYDRAALPALRGTPCVRCWLERSTTDDTTTPDDGLCSDCRERGRTGIPTLPADHTRADAIEARCAFITDAFPAAALRLLRRYWQQTPAPEDRATIARWVDLHHAATSSIKPLAEVPPAAEPERDACTTCGAARRARDRRHVNPDDGLCAACRALDTEPPINPFPDAVGEAHDAEHLVAAA